MVDKDMREECFHSPVFPSEVPLCHNTGPIPQAFLSGSPVNQRAVFPEAETVSPKMLHLNTAASLPSSSSSESQSNSKLNTAGRKQLPDKAHHSKTSGSSGGSKRRHGGDNAADKASAPSSKKSKSKAKLTSPSSHSQPKPQSSSHHSHRHQHAGGSDHSSKGGSTRRKASPSSSKSSTGTSVADPSATAVGASTTRTTSPPRSERDDYLVRSKRLGMTYKEIRKQGGFTEAESTLRGRFRTLTKPKEARVRKPEFQEIDDKLLKRGVFKLTKDVDEITRDNVPWKLVSEYMVGHGGSYHFGYTTVRKRWEYLMVTSEDQVKKDRLDHHLQH
ncbi:hypothetical protein F5883DRAFT_622873 [Diaporthe sp. PMI_573]|nr:hypothetical protein F5883DRAFT_622873 [Diaporthaceae sp. PMI_573]